MSVLLKPLSWSAHTLSLYGSTFLSLFLLESLFQESRAGEGTSRVPFLPATHPLTLGLFQSTGCGPEHHCFSTVA